MARTSAGWTHFARATDDARHELIERGWFGQYHRDPAMESDVARMAAQADRPSAPASPGAPTAQPAGLDGIGTRGDEDANWEAVKQAAHAQYEQDHAAAIWGREAPEPLDPADWQDGDAQAEVTALYVLRRAMMCGPTRDSGPFPAHIACDACRRPAHAH